MAHRVLTPSSSLPYTTTPSLQAMPQPQPSTAHPNKHSAATTTTTSQRTHGKENSQARGHAGAYTSHVIIASSHSTPHAQQPPTSPRPPLESPLLSSPYISSPQLSPFVAAAAAPSYAPSCPSPILSSGAGGSSSSHVVNHYHRPTASSKHASEPTMVQLLAEQPNAGASHYASRLDRDSTMANATGVASWRKGQGFKEWEKAKLNSAEVKRKADVAQLFFYDHYFDLLTYLSARKSRLATFKSSVSARNLSPTETASEYSSYCGRERVLLRKRRTKIKLDAFHIVTQVGQGGYGEVYLARHKETKQVVALKKMRKRTLLKMDEIRHVLTERDILASTNSPWLVKLLYAFQDPTYVYLAMDFIAGGDFRTLLNNSGVLKEEHARFYISEMFAAVNELHKLGYIHRDLKPENFLIDSTGHIKLTDFGLAAGALNPGKIENMKHKLDDVKDSALVYRSTMDMKSLYKSIRMADPRYADSVVGSPDYMAIETLRGQSYTFSVDYWSLGCILFEFLAGFPPFSGATADETWANLKNWQRTLRRPHYDRPEDRIFNLTDEGWNAITALINTKERRISTLQVLQAHPFFAGVEWKTLRDRPAPFIPALDSEVDSGYFDDFNSEADMAKYAEVREKQRNVDRVREKDDGAFNRGVFVGFTFKARGDKAVKDRERELLEKDMEDDDGEGETLETLF